MPRKIKTDHDHPLPPDAPEPPKSPGKWDATDEPTPTTPKPVIPPDTE